MDAVSRLDYEFIISKKLNIPVETTKKILRGYTSYIKSKVNKGESINVLRICRLQIPGYTGYLETLAYTSTQLAMELNLNKDTVKMVLFSLEECIIGDIKKYYPVVLNGVLQLELDEYGAAKKVRIRVSRALRDGVELHASTFKVFKRKVES